jgi:hypothetical protein
MSKQTELGSSRPNSMKKIAVASMIGTLIEFYDFLIYGTAAALVFAKVFFPSLGQSSGTILALRPLGWPSWRARLAQSSSGISATE